MTYYGINNEKSMFKAFEITSKEDETELTVGFGGGTGRVSLPFPGRHNVYNALAAAACALIVGVAFYFITCNVQLTELNQEIQSKQVELNALQSEEVRLRSEVAGQTSAEKVDRFV